MPPKSTRNGVYSQRLKAIRPFINFNYDLRSELTTHQKRRINQYFREIEALTMRPYHVFKPRSKAHLKTAQKFAQHEKQLPGLKVAFIPVADPKEKPAITFTKKGEMRLTQRHVQTRFIELDPEELLDDPAGHVNAEIKKHKKANVYIIQAGKYEIPGAEGPEFIAERVAFYVNKYNAPGNHYFGDWLHGINAVNYRNQEDYATYAREKAKNRDRLKRERAAAQKKLKREKEKAKNR